jgi:hypothetical protein
MTGDSAVVEAKGIGLIFETADAPVHAITDKAGLM